MEVDELQMQGSKFPRIGNCDLSNLGTHEEEETRRIANNAISTDYSPGGALGRFCGWPSSRIVRVSRASGGKDRHSKVWTSKGLRDRRVRLSVHTAIQFYDLQDRLGYDQPSKAVEWLLKKAAKSIDELPSINTSFPLTPDERGSGEVEIDADAGPIESAQHPHSSNSETSKGSGGQLSLSRSVNRVKARERAKERRAEKEKGKETDSREQNHHLISQSSFTELLTGTGQASVPMDYFPTGQFHNQIHQNHQSHQNQHHHEMQHFSLLTDHMMPVSADLNFTMSPPSMNRGTLQSNSQQSMLIPHHINHHFQRLDGSNVPFFIGTAASNAAPLETHHHHNNVHFPTGLQLYYNNLDHKGKGKN